MPQVHLVANKEVAFKTVGRNIWPAPDDRATIVIAHLVIEALLHRFIQTKLPQPKLLNKCEFTFLKTFLLARCFRKELKSEEWFWKTLKELNQIRNRLSHDIEIDSLEDMINKLYDIAGYHIDIHAPGDDPNEREANKLKYFLIILCGVTQLLQDDNAII